MTTLLRSFLAGLALLASVLTATAADTFTWKQRTNTGPVVDKEAPRLWYSMVGTTLTVTGVIDSTDLSNYLFMRLEIKDFKLEKGTYPLGTSTVYQYGARADMRFRNEGGSVTVTNVDHETNEITFTFAWNGYVKLQNDIELTIRITEGNCKVTIKPELSVVIRPSEKVKVKTDEVHRVTVYANKLLARDAMVKGATITLKHDGVVFEGEKTLTAVTGADGSAAFNLKARADIPGGKYTFTVNSKKSGFLDSKDSVFTFEVAPASRYYYSKCNGFPFFEFDAGDKEKFEDDGPPFILSTGNSVLMAGLIEVPGRVRIDTSGGGAKVYIVSGVRIPDVGYDGEVKSYVLTEGAFTFIAPNCGVALDFAIGQLVSEISGGKIKEPKLELVGDPAGASGLKIGAKMELGKNTYEGCNADLPFGTVYQPNAAAAVAIELGFLKGPSGTSLIASGTLSNFTAAPTWCIKEAKAEYRGDSSYFAISGKIKNALLSEASGLIAFKMGGLQTVKIDFTLDRCTPIPQAPSVCWRGGGFAVDNISVGTPLKGSVNAKFGPYDPLKDLYLLTIEGGFESSPAKVYGKVTGNLLRMEKVSKAKPFQAEISGQIDLWPGELRGALTVDGKLLHLGGDYFVTGKYSIGLGLDPVGVSATYDGSLKLPAIGADVLPKAGTLGKFINRWAPYPLGKVSGSLVMQPEGQQKATFTYDFRNIIPPSPESNDLADALRAIGQGTFSVDFTLLPSPAAWDFDGNFNSLLTSIVFGGLTAKAGEEQIQANEQIVQVPEGQLSLVSIMETSVANPNITLVAPSGTVYTTSDADAGAYRVRTPDGRATMWVVTNPSAGSWTIRNPDATPTDTISVYGVLPLPTMGITAEISGNNLVATWTGERISADAIVQVFVDRNNDGFDGQLVGTGVWSNGSLSVPLQDSTIPCTFNVYAVVVGSSFGGSQYASGTFSNPRATLPVPQGISASSTSSGTTTITFAPVLDARVQSVVVIDSELDSVLAAAYPFEGKVVAEISNHTSRKLRLASMNERGLLSCRSEEISITTSVNSEGPSASGSGYSLGVHPNPVRSSSVIRLTSVATESVLLRVVDARGIVVLSSAISVSSDDPTEITVTENLLSAGAYTALLHGTRGAISVPFVVLH